MEEESPPQRGKPCNVIEVEIDCVGLLHSRIAHELRCQADMTACHLNDAATSKLRGALRMT